MTAKKFKYKGHNPLREMVFETFGEDEDTRDSAKKKGNRKEKEKQKKVIPDEDLPVTEGKASPKEEGYLPSSSMEPQGEPPSTFEGIPVRDGINALSGVGREEKQESAADGLPTPREIASLIPSSLSIDSLRQWKVLPLQISDDMLEVGIPSMDYFQNAQILGAAMGYPVEVRPIPEEKLMALLRRLYDFRSGVADETVEAMEGIEDLDNLAREDVLSDSVDVPVIKLVNGLILDAIRQRATDIHVEPYEEHVQIRFRIDGVLHDRLQIPRSHQAPVTSRIKVMARMDIAEHMVPQDGRIGVTLGGKAVDIRVSSVPTQHGERIALRVLDKGHGLLSLEDLGMSQGEKKIMEDIIHIPHGMILFT
nr:ATPase, T2SS/T4P/T4SS family [Synergistales bacterium]